MGATRMATQTRSIESDGFKDLRDVSKSGIGKWLVDVNTKELYRYQMSVHYGGTSVTHTPETLSKITLDNWTSMQLPEYILKELRFPKFWNLSKKIRYVGEL